MINQDQGFNLTPLLAKGYPIAVWCPEEVVAVQFVNAVRKEFPKHFRHWVVFREDNENWSRYKERTCYCPNLNGYDGVDYFQFGHKEWFKDSSYTIINVGDLLECNDLGEFESFDASALSFFM